MAITTSKGSYQDYAYTGGMQSVTIPHDGIYKFEVWGAGGSNSALHGSGNYGNNYNTNGKGGYSVGYKLCKKGEVYYICVGGCNNPYNGGGRGNAGWGGGAGGGGGSGYIGGLPSFTSAGGTVYSPSTTAGGGNAVNADGSARVTFLRKNDVPVIFNGEQVEDVVLNGVKLTGMMVDGIRLYMKKRREKRCFA